MIPLFFLYTLLIFFYLVHGKNNHRYTKAIENIQVTCTSLPKSQFDALKSLYLSTNGPYWCINFNLWNISSTSTDDPCIVPWNGVSCLCNTKTGQYTVTSLKMQSFCMDGTIPSSIGNLTDLVTLSLYSNVLNGTLPSTIGYLINLQSLSLFRNHFYGHIPSEIGNLIHLGSLNLQFNEFSGPIPSTIGSMYTLQSLSLFNNFLTSTIPSDIGNLTSIYEIYLYNNRLIGHIPSTLTKLGYLEQLQLQRNNLTGPIPYNIGDLTFLNNLNLEYNQLSGSIPISIGNLIYLETLYLDNNRFNGSIPSQIGNLLNLNDLSLYNNSLSGTIPTEIGNLRYLEVLYLDQNSLKGHIPTTFGKLSYLSTIHLFDNKLSGPIPISFGSIVNLQSLYLYGNQLQGKIPSQLGNATNLINLLLSNNLLTGQPIPSSFSKLQKLQIFYCDNNLLSGSLSGYSGTISDLQYISLNSNHLTGLLSTAFFLLLPSLSVLSIFNNKLSGSISSAIGQVSLLTELIINDNFLSGPIFDYFNSTHQPYIQVINIANNIFSGHINFNFEKLVAISTSNNCLVGSLQDTSICDRQNTLQVIDMDGIGGNSACPSNIKLNDGKPTYINGYFSSIGLHGSISSCLFDNFGILLSLHLSGNNLVGTIPELSPYFLLDDLTLSNNGLTGTIPTSIQQHSFTTLDLSNNRLDGTLLDNFMVSPIQSTLSLAVNRLSGQLPSTLSGNMNSNTQLETLNILASNIFTCKVSNIPSKDKFSESYSCGSSELEIASYVMISIFVIIVILSITFYIIYQILQKTEIITSRIYRNIKLMVSQIMSWSYAVDYLILSSSTEIVIPIQSKSMLHSVHDAILLYKDKLTETKAFIIMLNVFTIFIYIVGIITIFIIIPVYIGFGMFSSIVSYDYGYVVSMAFLHGLAPVLFISISLFMILILFTISIATCYQSLQSNLSNNTSDSTTMIDMNTSTTSSSLLFTMQKYTFLVIAHIINITVTVAVNGTYVNAILTYSNLTRANLLLIQGSVAVFKFTWNVIYIPWCSHKLSSYLSISKTLQNRLIMSITNFIFAPCIATLAANQSCFYYIFKSLPTISSSIAISVCTQFSSCIYGLCCESFQSVTFNTTSNPSFHYSYACGTALLVTYVPVLIYSYTIYGFIVPVGRYMLTVLSSQNKFIQKYYSGRVKGRNIMIVLTLHLCVLLTFGIAAPILGIVVILAMLCDICTSRLFTVRYMLLIKNQDGDERGVSRYDLFDQRIRQISKTLAVDASDASDVVHTNPIVLGSKTNIYSGGNILPSPSSLSSLSSGFHETWKDEGKFSIQILNLHDSKRPKSYGDGNIANNNNGNNNNNNNNMKLSRELPFPSRLPANLMIMEYLDMKDAWKGMFVCYNILIITVVIFWSLLFFDMIADGYGIDDGIITTCCSLVIIPILLITHRTITYKFISIDSLETFLSSRLKFDSLRSLDNNVIKHDASFSEEFT